MRTVKIGAILSLITLKKQIQQKQTVEKAALKMRETERERHNAKKENGGKIERTKVARLDFFPLSKQNSPMGACYVCMNLPMHCIMSYTSACDI